MRRSRASLNTVNANANKVGSEVSTSQLFLPPDEIEGFIQETKETTSLVVVGEDDKELGICPFVTFYVYHGEQDFVSLGDKMIALYKEFETIIDEPFELIWKDSTQDWLKPGDKRLPSNLRTELMANIEGLREFWIGATDMKDPTASPRWSFYGKVDALGMQCYSTLKLVFRYKWYVESKDRWHAFVEKCLRVLQPEQCYSGFEIGNGDLSVMGAYEADVLERICADHFYGLDIDHPGVMKFQYHDDEDGWVNPTRLGSGIRTPTWCFLLSPYWQDRLGKTGAQVRAELNDPGIKITALPHPTSKINPHGRDALWIELGDLSLYPVEDGVPELLVKANRLIKPVRCDELNLLSLDPWDDDPNPRFDFESGPKWMARFDDDSEWPSPDKRQPKNGFGERAEICLRCDAGQPCPREGYWFTPARVGSRRQFMAGEVMPELDSSYGATIWQWDEHQES